MAIRELLDQVDAAFARVNEKRYAFEQAAATHAATAQDADAKLQKEIDDANKGRDEWIAEAQRLHDETVKATNAAREKASGELAAVEAEWDVLRAQLASVLGMDKQSRATVVGG